MNLNITAGSMGSAWFVVCSPQAIFNVYIMNYLGASASTLGFIVAITQFAALFHLASIFIYGRLPRKKAYWLIAHLVHRLFGLVLAGTAIAAAGGTDRGSSSGRSSSRSR